MSLGYICWCIKHRSFFFQSAFENSLKEGAYDNTVLGQWFQHFTFDFWVWGFFCCSLHRVYIWEQRTATLNQVTCIFHGKGVLGIRSVNSSLSETFQPCSWKKDMQTSDSHGCFGRWASSSAVLTVTRLFLINTTFYQIWSVQHTTWAERCSGTRSLQEWQWWHNWAVARRNPRSWAWFSLQNEKNNEKKNPVICYSIFIPCPGRLLSNCTIELNFINIYLLMLV